MEYPRLLLVIFTIVSFFNTLGYCQTLLSCPCYGCRPSGTFSYTIKSPKANASVAWTTNFFIGPVPKASGCVGNSNNIVCQSNGPREVGYISLDVLSGKLYWRDGILRFPLLPIMDIFGDIIGSDGHNLVYYEDSGQMKPVIKLSDWVFPIYSPLMTVNDIFMFVSRNGYVISYFTDGICHASIPLSGTVERSNGTFIPVATPVISGMRAYILTEFRPEADTDLIENPSILGMQRLYAIDIVPRMLDRLHISWYMNFERMYEVSQDIFQPRDKQGNVNYFEQESENEADRSSSMLNLQPQVMCNNILNRVYVNLPPPYAGSNSIHTVWGLQDHPNSTNGQLLFKVPVPALKMAMFEANPAEKNYPSMKERVQREGSNGKWKNSKWEFFNNANADEHSSVVNDEPALWILQTNREVILELSALNGTILNSINMSDVMHTQIQVTSDIMVTREHNNAKDNLVFGVSVQGKSSDKFHQFCRQLSTSADNKNYLVQIQDKTVLWMVPTPKDLSVLGQIAGIQNSESEFLPKDLLVAFAGNNETSVVFGVN